MCYELSTDYVDDYVLNSRKGRCVVASSLELNPRSTLALQAQDLHLWWAWLAHPEPHNFLHLLSSEEQERAALFVFKRDSGRFIISHAVLRCILSRYLGIVSQEIRFVYGVMRKPALPHELGGGKLHFNLAHSEEIILIGVANLPLGVDLEHRGRSIEAIEAEKIAKLFFSPAEQATLEQVPANRRTDAFLNCWTRKEAYVKAVGGGLLIPLDAFDVSLSPSEPARIVALGGDNRAGAGWSLYHLSPTPDYVGAVAIPSRGWNVSMRQFKLADYFV